MSRRSLRVHETPGYVLHASPWRETSLIVQSFTRDHGWVSMVAKGAKRPHSVLRGALSVFQPLLLSWTGAGEIKTLTRAECAGVHPIPGTAMMSCWYMNELLFRLLPREDPHAGLFDAYVMALQRLASGSKAAGALRRFEWVLLQETGYGLDAPQPDFDDTAQEPALRAALRGRLSEHLADKPLATRQVLLAPAAAIVSLFLVFLVLSYRFGAKYDAGRAIALALEQRPGLPVYVLRQPGLGNSLGFHSTNPIRCVEQLPDRFPFYAVVQSDSAIPWAGHDVQRIGAFLHVPPASIVRSLLDPGFLARSGRRYDLIRVDGPQLSGGPRAR